MGTHNYTTESYNGNVQILNNSISRINQTILPSDPISQFSMGYSVEVTSFNSVLKDVCESINNAILSYTWNGADISSKDSDYAAKLGDSIGDIVTLTNTLNDMISVMSGANTGGHILDFTQCIATVNKLTYDGILDVGQPDFENMSAEEAKYYYDYYISIPDDQLTDEDRQQIDRYLEHLKSKYSIDDNVTEDEKRFIALYEKIHADEAESMNTFFDNSAKDGLNEYDKLNIKYIAYTSEGDCHTIFFYYIDECKVEDWSYSGTSRYSSTEGNVKLNLSGGDGLNNPRGAYNTVFHELGHNMDDLMNEKGWFTGEISNGNFYDDLCEDVENEFSMWIDRISENSIFKLSQKDKEKILDVLMGRKSYVTLNTYLLAIADAIKIAYYNNYNGADCDQITDITDGITNDYMHDSLGMRGQYGHDGHIWEDSYWYYETDENGDLIAGEDGYAKPLKCGEATENRKSVGAQGKEFFAEYFAYEMTGDEDEENARKYFEKSYKVMDEAVARRAEEIRNRPTDQEMMQASLDRRCID